MNVPRARALIIWLGCIAFAIIVVARARYITDLSAFLPAHPTPTQQLLVDQLRDGPASRLILIAIEQGDAAARARVSLGLVERLRKDAKFASVNNGEAVAGQGDREFLFQHRYLLSEAVNAERFTAAGLGAAIRETIDDLASPAGLLFKSLLPRDPTGELLNVLDQLARSPTPESRDGVWVGSDGTRALAVAEIAAKGSDSDAQSTAIDAIRTAFAAAAAESPGGSQSVQLRLSGPGVFAVAARAKIERAAVRLSIASSILVVTLLLLVYRSLPALGLGLLPVATGALVGIAAVALGFGAVHGITLGFGITLIGESVDYSIYFFIQSRQSQSDAAARPRLAAVVVAHDTPGDADLGVRIRFAAAVGISRTPATGALLHQRPDRGRIGDSLCVAGLIARAFRDSRCDAARAPRWPCIAEGAATQRRPATARQRSSGDFGLGRAVPRSRIPVESRALGLESDFG